MGVGVGAGGEFNSYSEVSGEVNSVVNAATTQVTDELTVDVVGTGQSVPTVVLT